MNATPQKETDPGTLVEEILEMRAAGEIDPHDVADRLWWKHGRRFTQARLMDEEQVRAIILEFVRRTFGRTNRSIRRLPPLGWGENLEGHTTVAESHARSGPSRSRIGSSWLEQTLAVPDTDAPHPRYVLWGDASAEDWAAVADAYARLASANDKERARCAEYSKAISAARVSCLRELPPDEQGRLHELAGR